jgi:hypothetical protein
MHSTPDKYNDDGPRGRSDQQPPKLYAGAI